MDLPDNLTPKKPLIKDGIVYNPSAGIMLLCLDVPGVPRYRVWSVSGLTGLTILAV